MATNGGDERPDVRSNGLDGVSDVVAWLRDNPEDLANALGIEITLDEIKSGSGGSSVELKGSDRTNHCALVVTCRPGKSDDSGLGWLVAEAARFRRCSAVWIATDFSKRHRDAVENLNRISGGAPRLFAVALDADGNGDGGSEPQFQAIAVPKRRPRAKTTAKRQAKMTTAEAARYDEFWSDLLAELDRSHPDWTRIQTPTNREWIDLEAPSDGSATYELSFELDGTLRASVILDSLHQDTALRLYDSLLADRQAIEDAFVWDLEWVAPTDKMPPRISLSTDGTIKHADQWPGYQAWMIDMYGRLRTTFSKRLKPPKTT